MGQIGEPKRIYEEPEPLQVPDDDPVPAMPEPERVPA
jgi:hypothetical protein